MSRSNDPGHFFQTSTSLADSQRKTAKAKNNQGNPIKLRGKALACAHDVRASSPAIFVAQASGVVDNVNLETNEVSTSYTGPNAPLTCLAVSRTTLYAGCWDKSIYAWDLSTDAPPASSTAQKPTRVLSGGHTDFVKALLAVQLRGRTLVVSGGADAAIVVWDAETGEKLHVLKGHARGVQALALDPVSLSSTEDNAVEFVSADSSREIRRWRVGASSAGEVSMTSSKNGGDAAPEPLVAHETSVYALRFDADGDLWTASADKTAKCLVRDRAWQADTTLAHPDFVRDIVVDEEGGWVITACRDEEVRLWERGSGKLFHTFTGHFEEVTGLRLIRRKVVSISIDATVRQWSLLRDDIRKAQEAAEAERLGKQQVEEAAPSSMLTEEEERELAELMDEDD